MSYNLFKNKVLGTFVKENADKALIGHGLITFQMDMVSLSPLNKMLQGWTTQYSP